MPSIPSVRVTNNAAPGTRDLRLSPIAGLTDLTHRASTIALMEEQRARWRPLGDRDEPDSGEVLADGLPPYMCPSLQTWLLTAIEQLAGGYLQDQTPIVHYIERTLRAGPFAHPIGVWNACVAKPSFGLKVLDLLVNLADDAGRTQLCEALGNVLRQGGSLWDVGEWSGHAGLVRRVDETVRRRSALVTTGESNAAEHLAGAWTHLYGTHPDPARALDLAVKSLEAAARPVVTPRDPRPSLGKMIAALRDKPESWTVALGSVEELTALLTSIWTIQPRHGTDDPRARAPSTPTSPRRPCTWPSPSCTGSSVAPSPDWRRRSDDHDTRARGAVPADRAGLQQRNRSRLRAATTVGTSATRCRYNHSDSKSWVRTKW